jgi:hypothetical protein
MLAFRFEPFLESRRARREERGQELAAVQVECRRGVTRVEGGVECLGVAREPRAIEADLLGAATQDHVVAEVTSQEVNRATQGGSGALATLFGPEQCCETIPPLEPVGTGNRERDQQRKSPRLDQDGAQLISLRVAKVDGAE